MIILSSQMQSLLFLMIPNHRNMSVNNTLPDYVWLVHVFWTLPQRQFSSIYSYWRVRCWEAGCLCVKEAVAGIPNKSVPGRKPVLSLYLSAHGGFFPPTLRGSGLGQWQPACQNSRIYWTDRPSSYSFEEGLVAPSCQFLQGLSQL